MALPCTIKKITRFYFFKTRDAERRTKTTALPRAERRPRETTNTLGLVRRVPPPLEESDVLRLARDLVLEPLRVGLDVGIDGRRERELGGPGGPRGSGEFGAFSPFWGESGRGEALSGSFLGREGPQKSTPYPGFKLEFKKHTSNPKIQLKCKAGILNSS